MAIGGLREYVNPYLPKRQIFVEVIASPGWAESITAPDET